MCDPFSGASVTVVCLAILARAWTVTRVYIFCVQCPPVSCTPLLRFWRMLITSEADVAGSYHISNNCTRITVDEFICFGLCCTLCDCVILLLVLVPEPVLVLLLLTTPVICHADLSHDPLFRHVADVLMLIRSIVFSGSFNLSFSSPWFYLVPLLVFSLMLLLMLMLMVLCAGEIGVGMGGGQAGRFPGNACQVCGVCSSQDRAG